MIIAYPLSLRLVVFPYFCNYSKHQFESFRIHCLRDCPLIHSLKTTKTSQKTTDLLHRYGAERPR